MSCKKSLIPLTKGKSAIVDEEDFVRVNQFKWYHNNTRKTKEYARGQLPRAYRKKIIYMHRFIMNPPEGMIIHHINGNGLDNRKSNLYVCSYREHEFVENKHKKHKKSRFRGVSFDKRYGKYRARIRSKENVLFLGYFDNEADAAREYDKKLKSFGFRHAVYNFKKRIGRKELLSFLRNYKKRFFFIIYRTKNNEIRNFTIKLLDFLPGPENPSMILAKEMKNREFRKLHISGILCVKINNSYFYVKRQGSHKKPG